ncbi:DNA-3-methyladenine glycosylase I [Nanchangia anserum]|uniref:DNA-3-methyladenine glycosylase I n=1 Tax=Nanchangia anserum TaxID=2692125 RepID=A0A8I0KVW7_9ACTO|nr:DNA-3-methyladenine glycosylase I [Nanchangia anserum]MBD3689379.1 DNA-3-methyladenine glycosylase I [Nanchangia anserum]QOX81585.1 DNA-3-methyladenine glycosylase I [Nanchangia anserum]
MSEFTGEVVPRGLVRCDDGKLRPAWAVDGDMREYYDTEWGRPVRDERGVFARLCLECFQAGLAWATVMRKRQALEEAFAGFDPDALASFDAGDVERLLADPRIIRNRRKIEAVIHNARACRELRRDGGLHALVWSYYDPTAPGPRSSDDIPSSTPASRELARDLKRAGFQFVGPVTMYALMQAIGVVNDHIVGSHVRPN